jgi:alpha-glucosidase
MIRKIICVAAASLLWLNGQRSPAATSDAGDSPALASPDGRIELRISPGSSSSPRGIGFHVRFGGKELLQGELGLGVSGTNVLEAVSVKDSRQRESDSTYVVPFGKNNPVRDHFKELTLDLETATGPVRNFQVIFRAYDDGVAYRYSIPKQPGADSIEITDEPGRFQFTGDPRMWPLYLPNHTTSHEGIFSEERFSTLRTNQLIDVPLLAEFADGVSVSIAQASLRNYAGLYLKAQDVRSKRWLQCDLPALPGQEEVKVRSKLPLSSPWRVFLIGTAPGRLIESDLILNLNDPNAIGDTSWLKAGKASFYWWSGVQEPFDPAQAVKWEENYIDFCASNGLAFHAVIGTEGDHPWHFQTKSGYNPPGPDADVTRARLGFPIKEVVNYARSKGVGIRFWVNQKALHGHLEAAFTQYEKWGISGLMVDFLDRNDQEMVNFSEEILQSAARHHLHIQFHGVWAPTGLSRTYPNLFNHEGVMNLEYLKWGDRVTPKHDVTVPFTRMVAGPMDYHLGGFRGAYRNQFQHRVVKPIIFGTRCHQLAMYVVYENPMPMVCDTPDSYVGQPGFDFLREVPTTWDETRVLSGEVGEYIVLARRKGSDWYVGAMTDWTPRSLKIPLNFLASGEYQVETWADIKDDPDANHLALKKERMNTDGTLLLNLNSGGGEVIHISPSKEK